jgi:hypothetical protein
LENSNRTKLTKEIWAEPEKEENTQPNILIDFKRDKNPAQKLSQILKKN